MSTPKPGTSVPQLPTPAKRQGDENTNTQKPNTGTQCLMCCASESFSNGKCDGCGSIVVCHLSPSTTDFQRGIYATVSFLSGYFVSSSDFYLDINDIEKALTKALIEVR